jgi:hypothetical protein
MRKLRWTKTVLREPGYYWMREVPDQKPVPTYNAGREWTFIGTDQAAAPRDIREAKFLKMKVPE